MRKIIVAFLLLLGLVFTGFAQPSRRGSNGLDFFAQGGLNLGVEMEGPMKINDYILNDAQEPNNSQLRYGSSLKLFLNKVGLMVGYAITKTGGVNKVAMTGSKFNLGFNFCLGESHHKSPQVGCYFNWGTRNYYFKNTLFVPSASLNPNLITNEVNLLRFNQRSIGGVISVPVVADDKSSSRVVIGVEYNLNSSHWNLGETRIPEYGKNDFTFNLMYQIDFGYSRGRR
jgi:hypothetical protein